MASELPYWIQVLQALGTPAIALGAAIIGGLQWYTAHRKTIIDLFDRRYKFYSDVRAVIGEIARNGTVTHKEEFDFNRATDGVEFLFGKDVVKYVEFLRMHVRDMQSYDSLQKTYDADDEKRMKYYDKQHQAFKALTDFYHVYPELLAPYIRLDQRMPRSPLIRRWKRSGQTRI